MSQGDFERKLYFKAQRGSKGYINCLDRETRPLSFHILLVLLVPNFGTKPRFCFFLFIIIFYYFYLFFFLSPKPFSRGWFTSIGTWHITLAQRRRCLTAWLSVVRVWMIVKRTKHWMHHDTFNRLNHKSGLNSRFTV